MYNEDDDDRFIKEEDAKKYESRIEGIGIANSQTFKCPSCGSYNTVEQTEFEACNTCGWHVSY